MYYCEECSWEGKKLKEYTDLSRKEISYYKGCPNCSSDNISVLDKTKKEELILQAKRHLRGLERTIEKLEKDI